MDNEASIGARALDQFDACIALTSGARARYLARLLQTDPCVHAELMRMLAADEASDIVLQSPYKVLSDRPTPSASDEDAAQARIGSTLGAWRIDALIGRGGMGGVYRAHRADGQYEQEVALKCVAIDATSMVLAEVIRNERDMLAMLEHPNIATLLDGGVDSDGCPWFAMQLVQGAPVDAWCDSRRLDLRARVDLFIRLSEGLRHAHGKGMLHSDLKPSNMLVDNDGRPVLVDFGLSSLTARSHSGNRRIAISQGYTAPEVPVSGYSVASDVYALGVVLHGLLCGSELPQAQARFDSAYSLPLPSQCALQTDDEAARLRGLPDARALSRALAGDLDRIVSSCVAHVPGRRPESVAQLQADLRAWMALRPISLRRNEPSYRVRLFLRRHQLAMMVTAFVLVAAGVGLGMGLRLHSQASDHAEDARAMQQLFERSFAALTTGGLGQSPLMSVAMLRDAETSLRVDDAAGRLDGRSSNLMLQALARSYTTLGDYHQAMGLLDEAAQREVEQSGGRASLEAAKAHVFNIQSRHRQARDAVAAGLAALDAVPEVERGSIWLMLKIELARAQWGMADIQQGRATLEEVLGRAEAAASDDTRPLAALLIQRGKWHYLFSRYEEAVADFERAIELAQKSAPLIADDATMELIPTLKQLSQHQRAVSLAESVLEHRRRVLGDAHPETGKAWLLLGYANFWNGDADTALPMAEKSASMLAETLGEDHPEALRASLLVGVIHAHFGDVDAAVDNARRVLAALEGSLGAHHKETMNAMGNLGALLAVQISMKRGDAVDADWQEVIDLFARRVSSGVRQGLPMLSERMVLIKAQLRVGQVDEKVRTDMENIVTNLVETLGADNDAVYNARFTLIETYLASGREDLAHKTLEAMLRDFENAPDTMVSQAARSNCHEKLGDLAWSGGYAETARDHWLQARMISEGIESSSPALSRIQRKLARTDAG